MLNKKCSRKCGFGIQRRAVFCESNKGFKSSFYRCSKQLMPDKYQTCYQSCMLILD